MSFPAYERYKNSGVGWLGEVPEHWELLPVRAVVAHRDERNENAACQAYLSLLANIGVIPYEEKGDIGNKMPDDLSKCKQVSVGDIVINSMNYSIGSYGISSYDGVCSTVYVVLRANERVIERRFAFRIFQNVAFQRYAASFGNGILAHRAAISWDDLKGIEIALPPAEEQVRILTFLDREIAKIDTLIEEQRRLIALLKEKRQAVISHVVTKGLQPEVPMKGSGVLWLGEIPTHWSVVPLKALLSGIKAGPFVSALTKDMYAATGFKVYGQEQVIPADFSVGDYYISAEKFQELSQYKVAAEDILVSCVGTFGKVAVVPQNAEPGIINPRLIRLRCAPGIHPEFLAEVLKSDVTFEQFSQLSRGGTMDTINIETLKSIRVALPPYEEQEAILQAISGWRESIARSIGLAKSSASLLGERRSALVSAAVTGKIDVRKYVPGETPTPEDVYELA